MPHLASHLLARICRRVRADWWAKFRHPVHLLETFIETDRFPGTCYRAANWGVVGQTCGRGRQGPSGPLPATSRKAVLLFELHSQSRQLLTAPLPP